MTFYLCTTGIHTRLTSGQGKEAAPKPYILKAAFEGWQKGMQRCEGGKPSVITSDGKFIFNVHMTSTAYTSQGGVIHVSGAV